METTDALAKAGLRRSIALVLQKVGFDTATPEAFESFVLMAEECMMHRGTLFGLFHAYAVVQI